MYFQKEIISGKVVEIVKSYTKGMVKNPQRGPRAKKTPEQVQEENRKNAVKNLARILNCNFVDGDLWVTLTYKKDRRPNPEEAKKRFKNFIRRMGTGFKKHKKKLKWVTVTEYESKAIHHHLVINNPDGVDVVKMIREQWKENGVVHMVPLYSEGNYTDLAEYMVKETSRTFRKPDGGNMQRWSASRNMDKPVVRYRIVKAKRWSPQPKAKKGFYIDTNSIVNGVNQWTGREYQSYTMVRLE